MGSIISRIVNKWIGEKEVRCLMLGLDAAGKTTILYRLKLGDRVATIPTIGFNVETLKYKGFNMNIWDVGGQTRIRELWRHYYHNTQGLIFVIDSNDVNRMDEACECLNNLLSSDEIDCKILLVYANKQDLPNAFRSEEIANRLHLKQYVNMKWKVQACCAWTCDGLYEGFEWLGEQLQSIK